MYGADPRAAQIAEGERTLAVREELVRTLETRLEGSRRRLEERLQAIKDRRSVPLTSGFRLPRVHEGYFDVSSNVDEGTWWSQQLGKPPRLAA